MDLHGQIMNLPIPAEVENWPTHLRIDYKTGHQAARHAAAELALKADACIDALRELDARLRECSETPASAADAYDSFYRAMVKEALAAVG